MSLKIFEYDYLGFGIHQSRCKVYVKKITKTKPTLDYVYHICFEDMGVGTSVTNASEQLATEIISRLKLEPESVRFYESYLNEEMKSGLLGRKRHITRTFDEITYTWTNNHIASSPDWKPSTLKFEDIFIND